MDMSLSTKEDIISQINVLLRELRKGSPHEEIMIDLEILQSDINDAQVTSDALDPAINSIFDAKGTKLRSAVVIERRKDEGFKQDDYRIFVKTPHLLEYLSENRHSIPQQLVDDILLKMNNPLMNSDYIHKMIDGRNRPRENKRNPLPNFLAGVISYYGYSAQFFTDTTGNNVCYCPELQEYFDVDSADVIRATK